MPRNSETYKKPVGLKISTQSRTGQSPSPNKITSPLEQGSFVWSKSLRTRSRSPSPASRTLVNGHIANGDSSSTLELKSSMSRNKSFNPLSYSTASIKDSSTSMKKRVNSSNSFRKSTGSWASGINIAGKTSKTTNELADIEADYIKNLQQQIYFLELESNYLRDQAKKATDIHPKMTQEAERMLVKLRQMQSEMDEMQLDLRRKDSDLNQTLTEREQVEKILLDKEEAQQRQSLVMTDEIIVLKKAKDRLELEAARKNNQLLEAKTEVDKSSTALRNAEVKLNSLKNQLDQKSEQHRMTQIALEEKRTAMITTEGQLRDLEDRFYNTTLDVQSKVTIELKEEVNFYRQKLKEVELQLDKERYLREKVVDDSAILTRENSAFNHKISDLQQQLDRDRSLRDNLEARLRQNENEAISLREREQQYHIQIEQIKHSLNREEEVSQKYLEQVSKQEGLANSAEQQLREIKRRLTETEDLHQASESENNQLRKDKILLVDHVAELQRKIELKEYEVISLQSEVSSLDARVQDLDYQKNLESTVHSQKWSEFGKLAESMRTLSSTMARTSSPALNSQSKLLHY